MYISVKELKEKMVFAENIVTQHERILVAANTVVTGKHLHLLKQWGIQRVKISREDSRHEITINTQVLHDASFIINDRFQFNDLNMPMIKTLIKIGKSNLIKELSER